MPVSAGDLLGKSRILRAINQQLGFFLLDRLHQLHDMIRRRFDSGLQFNAADPFHAESIGEINPFRMIFDKFYTREGAAIFSQRPIQLSSSAT